MIRRDHLEILLAVAETGTLTQAAKRLNLTQSAVSHAVHRLQEEAGIAVWEPDGRRIRLTPAGRYLLGLAQRIVPQLTDADGILAGYAAGRLGLLRIGMECHPCYEWLRSVLPVFLEANPEVEIDVVQRHQFSGVEALNRHEIDVLITPDPLVAEGLEFEPVFRYELRLAAAARLNVPTEAADPEPYVGAEAFVSLTVLTYPVPRDRLDLFTSLLIPAGVEPREVRAVEATEVMLELVRAGRGVTALPDWMLRSLGPDTTSYRLGPDGIQKHVSVGFRSGALDTPYIAAFLDACKTATVGG